MRFQSMFRYSCGLVALALALATGSSIGSAQTADSEKLSGLLSQARVQARLADQDAATLESYTRSKANWKQHSFQLQRIREHVNELGELNKHLSDARAEGSAWQQQAVDQVDMRLREMAELLTVTINHLNDNQAQVHMQAYRDYAQANAKVASRLAKMIDDFVDYDEAKSKADSLEHGLGLPATGDGI